MSQASGVRHDILPPFRLETAVPDRLVHLIPDELAEQVPEHSIFAFPKTGTPQDGFVEVSAKCFANAINRTSWYLETLLGKDPQGFPSVGYMGSSEINPSLGLKLEIINSMKMTLDTSYSCSGPSKLGTRFVNSPGLIALCLHRL